jgi:excisionase family DNA binding protein
MAELMTVQEVAGYLRVNKKTIYRLLERGNIPAAKIGHQYRFNKASIDEWLQQGSMEMKVSIFVVDDENIIQQLFKESLDGLGHSVVTSGDSSEALALIKERDFDMVFLDLKMPGMDGAELFRQIKTIKPNLPVVIITGYPDSDMMARALANGPFGVMSKPFSDSDILAAVNNFIRVSKATGKMIGESHYH